jgi:phage gp45-like
VGDISSVPTVLDGGTSTTVIVTTGKLYRESFTNAALSGGEVIITHNLGNKIVLVQVSDNSDNVITPDQITLLSATQVKIVLGSFVPITGSWNVIVRG